MPCPCTKIPFHGIFHGISWNFDWAAEILWRDGTLSALLVTLWGSEVGTLAVLSKGRERVVGTGQGPFLPLPGEGRVDFCGREREPEVWTVDCI